MKTLSLLESARNAVASNPTRPATAVLFDEPDARLVVFRLLPGQAVPLHRNVATVFLTVLEGRGFISGETERGPTERACSAGDMIVYESNEAHSMRTDDTEMLLLATITPRPGERTVSL